MTVFPEGFIHIFDDFPELALGLLSVLLNKFIDSTDNALLKFLYLLCIFSSAANCIVLECPDFSFHNIEIVLELGHIMGVEFGELLLNDPPGQLGAVEHLPEYKGLYEWAKLLSLLTP